MEQVQPQDGPPSMVKRADGTAVKIFGIFPDNKFFFEQIIYVKFLPPEYVVRLYCLSVCVSVHSGFNL